jgi:hypothetical protein
VVAAPTGCESHPFAPGGDDRSVGAWRDDPPTRQRDFGFTRRRARRTPTIARATGELRRTLIQHVAMVAGHDHDASSATGYVQECSDLSQSFRRPCQVELVASRQLSIHGVVHDTDDALLGVCDSGPDVVAKLWPCADVGLVEKPGRAACAGCRNE